MKKPRTNLTPLIEINIDNKIMLIRGKNVMLDKDLAELYGVTVTKLNKAVKRGIDRFPKDSIFRPSMDEYDSFETQTGISKDTKHLEYLPQAFTQKSIDKLPSLLNSKMAIKANVQIMGAFNWRREMLLRYKDDYYRHVLDVACNKRGGLSESDTAVFLDVMQLLDDKIVDQIEKFTACNKGILLVGGNYDLVSGAVGYIWYTHPLQYTESGNDSVKDKWFRWPLIHKDFKGYSEDEIRTILFSEKEGILNEHICGRVIFLRDIKLEYVDTLERIARIVQGYYSQYRRGGTTMSDLYEPNIVIINAKKTEGLPKEILKQFEVVSFDTIEDVIEIDHDRKLLKYKNKTAELEPKQIELFELLWKNKDKVVYRNDILQELWSEESPYDRQIEKHISNLRDGLEKLGFKRDIIKTHKKSQLANEGGYEFHSDLSTFLK
jgi:DNA-binding winged helix-turn-helix (wHTH) protein